MTRTFATIFTLALVSPAIAQPITCDRFVCSDRIAAGHIQSHHVASAGKMIGRARASRSLTGVTPALAAKARKIATVCGTKIISTVRRTNIAGTRRLSLHAYGRAVDLQGNPACIYRLLARWPGGVSTDYRAMRHVHVSYDPQGREWGRRFAHRRVSKRNIFSRYAARKMAGVR